MSKNYLDKEKTILCTPTNLYSSALTLLNSAEEERKKGGNTQQVIDNYRSAAVYLREALLFGEGDAAYPLSYIYSHGLGVSKSIDQAVLWLIIGRNLGNPIANDLLIGEDYTGEFDLSELLGNLGNIDRKTLEAKALSYSDTIKNENQYSCNYTETGLQPRDIEAAAERFESADTDHTLTIIGEESSGCCCAIL